MELYAYLKGRRRRNRLIKEAQLNPLGSQERSDGTKSDCKVLKRKEVVQGVKALNILLF